MVAHGPETLALYIHWPFCLSKCPYCDFNSHVRDTVDADAWRNAYLAEIDHTHAQTPDRTITSVFFGGGTPSLMPPATAADILDRIAARWSIMPDVEITLEANPTSVEANAFAGFRAAGINRVSIGVQALDDEALSFLGREHSAADASAAIETAARTFPRISFDLIYARPGQSVAAWQEELARAINLAGDHLSVYQLTFEPGTPMHGRVRRGDITPPDEETCALLYESTQAQLADAGMPAYEISNHAREGAESRHNLAYWRYDDYAGIGPGAHGRITANGKIHATECLRSPEDWLSAVARDGHGTLPPTLLKPAEIHDEIIMMGLRTREGIAAARYAARTGKDLAGALEPSRLEALVSAELIEWNGHVLRATPDGRQRLNAVIAHLLT